MKLEPDFQCTWWPDNWFGTSLTDCCVAHDLGGSDFELLSCVADKGGIGFVALGIIMYIGVKIGRPFYRALQKWLSR